MFDAVQYQFADDFMGITERNALFYQPVCCVCCVGEAAFCRLQHFFFSDGHGCDHVCEYGYAHFYGVDGVKQTFLVFLHIFVVCQRQTFHGCQKLHQVAVNTACFAADQFCHIGVLFLGHDAGACGVCIAQFHEMEFMAAPEDDFFAETAQVHHQDGQCGSQFDGKVTVGNAVHGVHCDGGEAQFFRYEISVQRVCGSCQRAAAQRHYVCTFVCIAQAFIVAFEHFHISQQVVRQCHRLCALQVGIAGQDGFCVICCEIIQCYHQIFHQSFDLCDFFLCVHADIQCNLVVTAAAGVQAFAYVADTADEDGFHVHVDIFCFFVEGHLACFDISQDFLQCFDDQFCVSSGDDALFAQHFRMGHAACDIFFIHSAIEGDRGMEVVCKAVCGLCETSAPKFSHFYLLLSSVGTLSPRPCKEAPPP